MSIPTSVVIMGLVALWLAILVPMFAKRREPVPETDMDTGTFRVLRRAPTSVRRRPRFARRDEFDDDDTDQDDMLPENDGLDEDLLDGEYVEAELDGYDDADGNTDGVEYVETRYAEVEYADAGYAGAVADREPLTARRGLRAWGRRRPAAVEYEATEYEAAEYEPADFSEAVGDGPAGEYSGPGGYNEVQYTEAISYDDAPDYAEAGFRSGPRVSSVYTGAAHQEPADRTSSSYPSYDEGHRQDLPRGRGRGRRDRIEELDEAHLRPVPRRPGRGGYDPDAAEAARAYRYSRRRRVAVILLLATIAFSVAAYFINPMLWTGTAVSALLLVAFLTYLRRQVRIENDITARRLARLRRARQIRPEYHLDREDAPITGSAYGRGPVAVSQVPPSGYRRGREIVDLEDDDPSFDDLDYYQPALYRRASGQ